MATARQHGFRLLSLDAVSVLFLSFRETQPTLVNRLLILFGTILIVAGLSWPWLRRLPLFHLPGDIIIDRPGFKFFFPLTSLLLISAVISLLTWLFRR
jgi:uncharacterized membrane protein